MNEELFEIPLATVNNLKSLGREQSIDCERRICELAELCDGAVSTALSLFEDGLGIYEILGLLSERLADGRAEPYGDALSENRHRLAAYFSLLSAHDRAVLSQLLCEKLLLAGIKLSEEDFLPTGRGNEAIAYVKNRLADEAYDVLSQELTSPTVIYASSFKEATAAVADGRAEYCLLPLEEGGGARLAGVAALIFSEELKINSVTPVFGFDGSADMKYALVSRHFTVPAISEEDDRYLEIRGPADGGMTLSELFAVSGSLGVTVYRINTLYFNAGDGQEPYYSIVFRNSGRDFSELLLFLTLFCGSYTAVGIYKNLE